MIISRFYIVVLFILLLSFAVNGQRSYAPHSVLSAGNWYQLGVTKEGVYKLTAASLSQAGVISGTVTSNAIRIFGNGGAMLPENNRTPRPDDLVEMPLKWWMVVMVFSTGQIICFFMPPDHIPGCGIRFPDFGSNKPIYIPIPPIITLPLEVTEEESPYNRINQHPM